ncbi:MAG: diaminopimelate decarboxylase [Acidobacteria bacterium]|nr:MAG: diaminopimelate decarboxylase [Acidobacteriota bacterium]
MFTHRDGTLTCEGVPLRSIVDRVGTPVYVYSRAAIENAFEAFDQAFAGYPHTLHYALKANSNLAIARLLRALGASVDANSGGEIDVALRAGFSPNNIVFTGVGKTPSEMAKAIRLGVKAINIESPGEMERIAALAQKESQTARIALRVNPDIDALSHPHISTGKRANKFGVSLELARDLCRRAANSPGISPVGIHIHIGSQILDVAPLVAAARVAVQLALDLREDGIDLEHLDLGGGLGISYDGRPTLSPADYAGAILPVVKASGLPLLLEPGRWLVGPSAVLLTRVVDVKSAPGAPCFAVTDAGMTELMRPMLYGAFHAIEAVEPSSGASITYDVVGPLCETSDTLGRDRLLPPLQPGDLLAVRDVGAYGAVMGSNYNRRLFAPEVLVSGDDWTIIRRRQTMDDLLALEEQI